MIRSIRLRLLLWYAFILLWVVGGFAGILYYEVRATRYLEVDTQLEAAAENLNVALRAFPPHELNGEPPPERDRERDRLPPPGKGKGEKNGPPPKGPPRERLLTELALPPAATAPVIQGGRYFAVWRFDGSLLKQVGLPADTPRPTGAKPRPDLSHRGPYRELVVLGPMETIVLVGRPFEQVREELNRFAWQVAGTGLAVLAVGLAGGWWISRRILRPIATIAAAASRITEVNLSARIDEANLDVEVADLARILNETFARLEGAFQRQAQFTADASHELRTPLSILRSQAELTLSRSRTEEEYRKALGGNLAASIRLSELVERLLLLARADVGQVGGDRKTLAFDRLVAEVAAQMKPLADKRGIEISTDLQSAVVHGDAGELRQVVFNLLDNAMRYNRESGLVEVRLTNGIEHCRLSIRDSGHGIAEEHRPHLFARFYRVDAARNRSRGGTGLGLAICKAIVQSHGGTIDYESTVGEGTTFTVRLPLAKPSEAKTVGG